MPSTCSTTDTPTDGAEWLGRVIQERVVDHARWIKEIRYFRLQQSTRISTPLQCKGEALCEILCPVKKVRGHLDWQLDLSLLQASRMFFVGLNTPTPFPLPRLAEFE